MTTETKVEPTGGDSENSGAVETCEVRPTYAPAVMALGVMLLLWGIVTLWFMSATGVGLIAWSLWMWIDDLRKE